MSTINKKRVIVHRGILHTGTGQFENVRINSKGVISIIQKTQKK